MRTLAVLSVVGLMLYTSSARAAGTTDAKAILERYLAAPIPKGPSKTDPYDPNADRVISQARLNRLAILKELAAMPDEAVAAAEPVIFKQASSDQRYEIVSMLGDLIQTRAYAELLHRVLQDVRQPKGESDASYEELVRSSAAHGLRNMSSRIDRRGGKRIQDGAVHEPKVPGLVPWLIEAADDPSESVRVSALFGLADSLDPAAVAELRNRLKDDSEIVRFHAACFLTEFQDASGLPEMRQALDRLRKAGKAEVEAWNTFNYWLQVERLLASFERITGKSFGEIPLNPTLSSTIGGGVKEYRELMDAWAAWWDWRPERKIVQTP
jgi:hypothetical protein